MLLQCSNGFLLAVQLLAHPRPPQKSHVTCSATSLIAPSNPNSKITNHDLPLLHVKLQCLIQLSQYEVSGDRMTFSTLKGAVPHCTG